MVNKSAKNSVKGRIASYRIQWIKLTCDEEFVALVKPGRGGYHVKDPMLISYVQGVLVLSPYGLLVKDADFFVRSDIVVHSLDVTDSMRDLFKLTMKTKDMAVAAFDHIIKGSIDMVNRAVNSDDAEARIIASKPEMEAFGTMIEEALGHPPEFASGGGPRNRSQTIDSLVKLAEKVGKGKKKVGDQ